MGMFDLFRRPKPGGPEAMRARLEGAMAKRRLRGWNPPLENINALVASGGPRLLARSRELVVTNGYAANACEAFAANLVGDGIKPSATTEHVEQHYMKRNIFKENLKIWQANSRFGLHIGEKKIDAGVNGYEAKPRFNLKVI